MSEQVMTWTGVLLGFVAAFLLGAEWQIRRYERLEQQLQIVRLRILRTPHIPDPSGPGGASAPCPEMTEQEMDPDYDPYLVYGDSIHTPSISRRLGIVRRQREEGNERWQEAA